MLSNMPDFLMWTAIFVSLSVIALASVKIIITLMKSSRKEKIYVLTAILCVLIMVASWFMNFGWLRFAFTIVPLPLVHIAALLIITVGAVRLNRRKINLAVVFMQITFLLSYLLLPDGGDVGGLYMFFGLIHNDTIAMVCAGIASTLIKINIVIMIVLLVKVFKAKKKIKAEVKIKTESEIVEEA